MTATRTTAATAAANTAATTDAEMLGDEALATVAGGTIFRVKLTDAPTIVPTPEEATDKYIRRHTQ